MRIDGTQPEQNGVSINRAESNRPERASSGRHQKAALTGSADRVALSPDAKLMAGALKAAGESPAVRQELVERLRQKLAAGEVGSNVERLAESLITHLLAQDGSDAV